MSGAPFAIDEGRRLGVCGDLFQGVGVGGDDGDVTPAGVEAAALSGDALGRRLAALLRDARE